MTDGGRYDGRESLGEGHASFAPPLAQVAVSPLAARLDDLAEIQSLCRAGANFDW